MKILELFLLGGSSLERKNANNYGIFLHNSKEVGVELGFFFFFFFGRSQSALFKFALVFYT